jgi:hypothetical protein
LRRRMIFSSSSCGMPGQADSGCHRRRLYMGEAITPLQQAFGWIGIELLPFFHLFMDSLLQNNVLAQNMSVGPKRRMIIP